MFSQEQMENKEYLFSVSTEGLHKILSILFWWKGQLPYLPSNQSHAAG